MRINNHINSTETCFRTQVDELYVILNICSYYVEQELFVYN